MASINKNTALDVFNIMLNILIVDGKDAPKCKIIVITNITYKDHSLYPSSFNGETLRPITPLFIIAKKQIISDI